MNEWAPSKSLGINFRFQNFKQGDIELWTEIVYLPTYIRCPVIRQITLPIISRSQNSEWFPNFGMIPENGMGLLYILET